MAIDCGSHDLKPSNRHLSIAAEYYAHFVLLSHGYQTMTANPGSPFDLVAVIDGKLCKVQVKATASKAPSGHFQFNLRMTRHNTKKVTTKWHQSEDCDYFL